MPSTTGPCPTPDSLLRPAVFLPEFPNPEEHGEKRVLSQDPGRPLRGLVATAFAVGLAIAVAFAGETSADGRPKGDAPAPDAGQDAAPSATLLLERIEDWGRAHPHFEARFEQRFVPRLFGRERVESGRLTVRRPGRMRWDYETPEEKVFVSDGENTWFHLPADRQVVVGSFGSAADERPGASVPPNPLDFLTGAARIADHFEAVLLPSEDRGRHGAANAAADPGPLAAVSLEPTRPGGELASLRLLVEPESGRLRGIVSEDFEGNRTEFRFDEFRVGAPPDESRFTFRIPPGTEVVTAPALAAPLPR